MGTCSRAEVAQDIKTDWSPTVTVVVGKAARGLDQEDVAMGISPEGEAPVFNPAGPAESND